MLDLPRCGTGFCLYSECRLGWELFLKELEDAAEMLADQGAWEPDMGGEG